MDQIKLVKKLEVGWGPGELEVRKKKIRAEELLENGSAGLGEEVAVSYVVNWEQRVHTNFTCPLKYLEVACLFSAC